MTELKEIETRPFAFLKISASPLAAHLQVAQPDPQAKALPKSFYVVIQIYNKLFFNYFYHKPLIFCYPVLYIIIKFSNFIIPKDR